METFAFGLGAGRLTKAAIRRRRSVARKHEVEFHLVHGNGGDCVCGRGCNVGTCPVFRYWFTVRNYGEPFNSRKEREVMEELTAQ